jgi:hypothetical protein
MKFRLISKKGNGLPLAERLNDEGFKVDVWIKEATVTSLPRALSWNNHLAKDTIILFDYHGAGKIADTLSKNGFIVYGAGVLNDSIEGKFGSHLAEMSGIKMPRKRICKTFNEALGVDNEGELRFQPQKDGEQHYTLQERIAGPQMSVERYYVYGRPISKTLNSKLEAGNAAAVRLWKKNTPRIYNMTLRKIEPFLTRFKYTGPLTCKVVVHKEPYLLEWVARFTSNGIAAFCEALNKKIGDLIIESLNGKDNKVKPNYEWYCSNGTAQCPDDETQAGILNDVMGEIKQLQKWRYL